MDALTLSLLPVRLKCPRVNLFETLKANFGVKSTSKKKLQAAFNLRAFMLDE
jgi:hypothetical protein